MLTGILSVIAFVNGVNWLKNYLALMALARHMVGKGYTPPSNEEIKAYTEEYVRHILHLDNKLP